MSDDPTGSTVAEAEEVLNATVRDRTDFHGELSVFHIAPDEGRVPEFEPGQFCVLGLPDTNVDPAIAARRKGPKLTRRAYSIASAPNQTEALELYIVRVDDGKLTPQLWSIQPGGRLWLSPSIKGEFTLERVPRDADLLLVSTGTGLAPYISMIRQFRGLKRWRRCVVVHGVRVAEDLGYREELERLAAEDPTIGYVPYASREPEDSGYAGRRGRVTDIFEPDVCREFAGFDLDPERLHVFLCGNPAMIDQGEQMLKTRGFVTNTKKQPGNIHFERYW